MRVKKFTTTLAQINVLTNGQEIEISVGITPDQLNNDSLPRIVRINNTSGAKLGYVIIGNETEKAERVLQPTWYTPIPIESGISDLSLGSGCRWFYLVQLDATTSATGNIDLYFGNYFNY